MVRLGNKNKYLPETKGTHLILQPHKFQSDQNLFFKPAVELVPLAQAEMLALIEQSPPAPLYTVPGVLLTPPVQIWGKCRGTMGVGQREGGSPVTLAEVLVPVFATGTGCLNLPPS